MPEPPGGEAPARPGSADESQLVQRVRDGDVAAFDALARRYEPRAYAIAYRLLRHREDAEDLVQEAFMTALDRLDTFQRGRPFGPWFLRIVTNRGLNAIAARRVRATEPLPEQATARDATPERVLEQAELRARVEEALAGLSDRQRLAVQLYELDGFSTKEIAGVLGVTEATVRWTLHIARRRLRELLAPYQEEEGDG
jgi:RNA polymerase sigma-70 factor (ECF subfamily)